MKYKKEIIKTTKISIIVLISAILLATLIWNFSEPKIKEYIITEYKNTSIKNITIAIPKDSIETFMNITADKGYDIFNKPKLVVKFYKNKIENALWTTHKNITTTRFTKNNKTINITIQPHPLCKSKTLVEISIK